MREGIQQLVRRIVVGTDSQLTIEGNGQHVLEVQVNGNAPVLAKEKVIVDITRNETYRRWRPLLLQI